MTPEQLKEKGGIYFERIQQGMSMYHWESEFLSPRMAEQYLRTLWMENGSEDSFVDCYFSFLEEESQEKVLSVLSPDQQEYLRNLAKNQQDLILPLSEELLKIAIALNDTAMLFFTFYFTKNPCTIWGNYKQEYLIFSKKEAE